MNADESLSQLQAAVESGGAIGVRMTRALYLEAKMSKDALRVPFFNPTDFVDSFTSPLPFMGLPVTYDDSLPAPGWQLVYPKHDRRCLYCRAFITHGDICRRCEELGDQQ